MFTDNLQERFMLVTERIGEMVADQAGMKAELSQIPAGFSDYFCKMTDFAKQMIDLYDAVQNGIFEHATLTELADQNHKLYEDILPKNYATSYANPVFAVQKMGKDYGTLFSFLYVELRGMIVYAHEQRMAEMTILLELYLELYCMVRDSALPEYREFQEAIYWYLSDYSDEFVEYRVREQVDPTLSFARDIILNANLESPEYLYRFGEYITDNEIKTAMYLATLSEEQLQAMAHTFVEGYRKGFELGNKPLHKKKTVNIRYCLGFERLVKAEIEQFRALGLESTIYRAAVSTINKKMHVKIGYYGAIPNQQMEYDHRFDNAIYLDSNFVERKLGALKLAYENYKEQAAEFGGPAVMEVFGEIPFEPKTEDAVLQLDERQQKMQVKYDNEAASITNAYIKGEERSFTIIAYPTPEIGPDFAKIFEETVRINTLDYALYQEIQQKIIDVLDQASYVEVIGCNGNQTDIRVQLMQQENPAAQTTFENCLADVNIPLGEVFTSPVLAGTTGLLHVSSVYLNDLAFQNLKVRIQDGMVADYSCDNFADAEKSKAFFKENVLFHHDTLPVGEFAIGTNTTAYVMANRYKIVYQLPILIVEKMGPHFALGDTCYSHAEDVAVFNPDGKEIIARDNEVSLLRKTTPDKAYFNCHTDITIPYDEIGRISAVHADGTKTDIICNGRFVLDGCEELNRPFE